MRVAAGKNIRMRVLLLKHCRDHRWVLNVGRRSWELMAADEWCRCHHLLLVKRYRLLLEVGGCKGLLLVRLLWLRSGDWCSDCSNRCGERRSVVVTAAASTALLFWLLLLRCGSGRGVCGATWCLLVDAVGALPLGDLLPRHGACREGAVDAASGAQSEESAMTGRACEARLVRSSATVQFKRLLAAFACSSDSD